MGKEFARQGGVWEHNPVPGFTTEMMNKLRAQIIAGDVEIKDIIGNKDIELSAGDLTIYAGDAADYSHVRASVNSGSIEASPFGESRGGLFRSFEKYGKGKYNLMAHVGAGDLTLK